MARTKFATSPEALNAIFLKAIPLSSQSEFSGVSMWQVRWALVLLPFILFTIEIPIYPSFETH